MVAMKCENLPSEHKLLNLVALANCLKEEYRLDDVDWFVTLRQVILSLCVALRSTHHDWVACAYFECLENKSTPEGVVIAFGTCFKSVFCEDLLA